MTVQVSDQHWWYSGSLPVPIPPWWQQCCTQAGLALLWVLLPWTWTLCTLYSLQERFVGLNRKGKCKSYDSIELICPINPFINYFKPIIYVRYCYKKREKYPFNSVKTWTKKKNCSCWFLFIELIYLSNNIDLAKYKCFLPCVLYFLYEQIFIFHDCGILQLEWARSNDDKAKLIGQTGRHYIQENLMPRDVYCYHAALFQARW